MSTFSYNCINDRIFVGDPDDQGMMISCGRLPADHFQTWRCFLVLKETIDEERA